MMNTLDKLHNWGVASSNICVLCNRSVETQEHLFFQCRFSKLIWDDLIGRTRAGFRGVTWDDTIAFLSSRTGWQSNFQKDLVLFGFAAAVYHIWRERNTRIFSHTNKDNNTILKEILDNITYATAHWRGYKCIQSNWEFALNFGLSQKIFSKVSPQVSAQISPTDPA